MRTSRIVIALLIVLFYQSCQNSVKQETNSLNSVEGVRSPEIKYGYVLFMLESPELVHSEAFYGTNPTTGFYERVVDESNYVTWKKNGYISDVVEIENLDEDKKYKLIDDFEKDFNLFGRSKMDIEFRNDISLKVRGLSKREELRKNKSRIVKREFFSFDSYAEASKRRRKIMQ